MVNRNHWSLTTTYPCSLTTHLSSHPSIPFRRLSPWRPLTTPTWRQTALFHVIDTNGAQGGTSKTKQQKKDYQVVFVLFLSNHMFLLSSLHAILIIIVSTVEHILMQHDVRLEKGVGLRALAYQSVSDDDDE